jgi:ABC-type transporter Mla subunit MlaD
MNEQALRFRIGVFVLASLLLLAVLITLFGSFPRVFSRGQTFTVRFQDASGIGPGTPVRKSGVRIGEVKSVRLDDETGVVLVGVQIDRPFTLRRGDQATLVYGLLGGDTFVDFVARRPGVPEEDRTPLEPGTELEGVRLATVSTLLSQASEVMPTTQEALNEIRRALQRLDRLTPAMEETAKEFRELARTSREVIPELRKTTSEIGELAKATRESVPDIRKSVVEVGETAKVVRDSLPEFKKTATEAQVTLRTWDRLGERTRVLIETNEEKISKILERTSDTLTRLGNILTEENQRHVNAIVKNVRNGSERLDGISKNAEEVLQESRLTLKRFNDSLGRLDEVLINLEKTTKPLGERSTTLVKNLEEASSRLVLVLGDVQALFKTLDQENGTVRRLLTDSSLYNRLDEAACMVNKILPRVDRMLRDVEIFADKIARHPESLGIGGAIRPSGGLKESPSLPTQWRSPSP